MKRILVCEGGEPPLAFASQCTASGAKVGIFSRDIEKEEIT